MNYIILDLEWNQSPDGKEYEDKNLPFEIIEIGAVKLNREKKIIDEFSQIIKPKVYRRLHFHTKEVIKISYEELNNGMDFPEAAEKFLKWCGEDFVFCTWGSMDLTEFQRNLRFYHMPELAKAPFIYYDIQKFFSFVFEDRKIRRALEFAVDYLEIPKKIPFHRAVADAYYTAEVLRHIKSYDVERYYSIDVFHPPKRKKEEVYAVFDTYSKYISREFKTKEDIIADKEVSSTRCYLCGKPARKKIRWFSANQKVYYCQAYCENHGYIKGKIRIKKSEAENVFAIKILKLVKEDEANKIKAKQEEVRKKRRNRKK